MRRLRRVAVPHEEEVLSLRNKILELEEEVKTLDSLVTGLQHTNAVLRSTPNALVCYPPNPTPRSFVRFSEMRDIERRGLRIDAYNEQNGLRASDFVSEEALMGNALHVLRVRDQVKERLYEQVTGGMMTEAIERTAAERNSLIEAMTRRNSVSAVTWNTINPFVNSDSVSDSTIRNDRVEDIST